MAVTFDAAGPSSAGASGNGVANLTWTHTVAAGPCAALAGCGIAFDAATITATCGGTSMAAFTAKVHNNFSGTSGFTQLFGLANVSTGAKTIVLSGATTDYVGGSQSYAGADTVTPFGTPVTAPASAVGVVTAASVTVAGTTAGNMVAGVCTFGAATVATSGGTTQRWAVNPGGSSAAGNACGGDKAAGGSVTLNWTDTAGDWFGAIGVEVLAGAGGGAASPVGVQPQRGGRTYRRKWDRPQQQQFPSQVVIPQATVTAGLAAGTGTAAAPVFGNYITGLAGSGNSWFITNQGTPKLLVCDNPWALIPNAGRWNGSGGGTYQQDIDNYCNARGGQGFTGTYLDPLGNLLNGGVYANGRTWDGVTPFVTGTDPSSGLNGTFWARVDYFITACARNNMVALVNIAYSGGSSSSANADMDNGGALDSKTSTQYTDYGSNLAARYAATPNIIWVVGNDYFGSYDTPFSNILTGLRNGGDTHLITIHNNAETTSRYDCGTGGANAHEAWGFANAQFNFVYTYTQTYFCIEYALAETSPITTIWGDGYFYSTISQDRTMRQFHWWAVASGARGTSTGSEAIWKWLSTAPAAVTTGAWYTTQNAVIRNTIEPLANWQNLQAAPGSAFITAGRGTRYGGTTSGGGGAQYASAITDNYIAASLCADKSLAVIYFSAGTASSTITIDQTKLATGYTATWVDPASGAQTSGTPGATYANHGTNSAGDRDWVLILAAPPATTANAGLASGTGAALGAAASTVTGTTVTAVLATGTGAAAVAVPAAGVNAVPATEAGAALNPAVAVAVTAVAATEAGAALNAAPAVAVNATAATEAGAALNPAVTATASPLAGLASGAGAALNATASTTTSGTAAATGAAGAGAAQGPAAAIGVTAAAATGTGAAQGPAATAAAAPAAVLATGTGTALNPAVTITVTAGLASGAGTALNATASTTTAGTGAATVAAGTGAALGATVAAGVTATLAAGAGTALNATASTASAGTANAAAATGTGTAQGATAGITVTATAATATGAALGTAVASAASPAPAAAAGTGTALNPAAATGVPATLATGTGTAQGATVTATASPAATLATGAGAALNATASTFTAGTANAGLATGTGTAASATPAIGAAAAPATGAGTALNATVSTAAFTNAQAGLATGTGTARNPGLTLTSNATAAPATGTGATASAPAIGVNATPATGAGTGRNATGQIGWVATAGVATGTGTAPSPVAVLVSLAQTAAAAGLGAALRATAKTVDPFTVGTLTTATAAGTLTAATSGGGGTLTASDQRTGGPGG